MLKLTKFDFSSSAYDQEPAQTVTATITDTEDPGVYIIASVPVPGTLKDTDEMLSLLRAWLRKIDLSKV